MNYLNYSIVVVLGVIEASAGNFTHEMPQATNEKPLDTSYAELAETFRNPFGKVQTGCYWYWYRGNVSVEGVRKDLAAMKRAGIDRAFIGDIGAMGKPRSTGPVEIFSPEWEKAVATAFEEATRLGIEIGLFNGPGWSMAGGPWVKPEQAMRRFVSSETIVEGPAKNVKLVQHDRMKSEKYHDLFAIAYPVTDSFGASLKNKTDSVRLAGPTNAPSVVELTAADAFAAQSVKVTMRSGAFVGRIAVEAEDGGKWRTLCDERFSQYFHAAGTTFSSLEPLVAVFEPVSAKRFRVTITPERSTKNVVFKSVEICAAPLVEQFNRKSLARMHEMPTPLWTDYKWRRQPAEAKGTALDPAKSVKLYGKVAKDGTLDWDVPAGKWVIYRFGVAPTPAKNGPAFGIATGHEVDKMNAAHVGFHFDSYIAKLLALVPPEKRKSVRYTVMDSWEQGSQNCTDDFAERFKAAFGYDPTPYLPALFGTAVADRETSDRFLWDVRRFVADETAYSFVGGLRRKSNANGMRTWLENYGHWGFPGEFLQYGGQSDEVAGEFGPDQSRRPNKQVGDIENRGAASCAHTYGKRLVWAESFTSAGRAFARGPMDLKASADRFFAEGLNATILHVYLHQLDERKPGINAWFGTEFNRHNTWFEHFDLFSGYLKRCGWMLRQGLNVADVAYFIGEDVPCMEGDTAAAPLPFGRQFDFINAEVLKETARVDEKGRIVLPHGTAYEVLVLPRSDTMRPEMLECVERLVNAGAFVLAPVKPVRSPSLAGQPQSDAKVKEIADRLWGVGECKMENGKCKVGKFARRGNGVVAWGMTLEEALKMRGSVPDVVYDEKFKLAYAHRTMPNAEIYFVSNQSGEAIPCAEVSFRISGKGSPRPVVACNGQDARCPSVASPELWDAATGERRVAEKWRMDGGRTVVTLSLAKHESVFVVFSTAAAGRPPYRTDTGRAGSPLPAADAQKHIPPVEFSAPWNVSFQSDALHRGPKDPLVIAQLVDFSTSTDSALKYYSGRITYKTKFRYGRSAGTPSVPRVVLDLGEVAVTAKVKINGKVAGGVCFAPYRLDVTPFVREGENRLEIEVCNLWANRLVGDDGDPDRPTWTSKECCGKSTKLPKSGLLGPVRIFAATKKQ